MARRSSSVRSRRRIDSRAQGVFVHEARPATMTDSGPTTPSVLLFLCLFLIACGPSVDDFGRTTGEL